MNKQFDLPLISGPFFYIKRIGVFFALLMFVSSCSLYDRKESVFITDQDFVENYRELSPDSTMILINYSIDLGAFGYGQAGTAILKTSDTTKDLRPYSLPNTLIHTKWLYNKVISAEIDIIPSIRAGDKLKITDIKINEVLVKVSALDYIEPDYHLKIEHREASPNGKHELVAYRYLKDNSDLNFIHISVIPSGEEIPKYGNYFIADNTSDYILYGAWDKNNTLIFYTNEQYYDLIQYYFVHGRLNIPYRIIKDNQKYGSKYTWVEKF